MAIASLEKDWTDVTHFFRHVCNSLNKDLGKEKLELKNCDFYMSST